AIPVPRHGSDCSLECNRLPCLDLGRGHPIRRGRRGVSNPFGRVPFCPFYVPARQNVRAPGICLLSLGIGCLAQVFIGIHVIAPNRATHLPWHIRSKCPRRRSRSCPSASVSREPIPREGRTDAVHCVPFDTPCRRAPVARNG